MTYPPTVSAKTRSITRADDQVRVNLDAIASIVRATVRETVQAQLLAFQSTSRDADPEPYRPVRFWEQGWYIQYQRERARVDRVAVLALTGLGCEEHRGEHRQVAVRRPERHADGQTVAVHVSTHCSVSIWIQLAKLHVQGVEHVQFKAFPESPKRLEEALA